MRLLPRGTFDDRQDGRLTKDQILDSRRGTAIDPKTDALIRFARKLVDERGRVSNADVAEVRAVGFDDSAIAKSWPMWRSTSSPITSITSPKRTSISLSPKRSSITTTFVLRFLAVTQLGNDCVPFLDSAFNQFSFLPKVTGHIP